MQHPVVWRILRTLLAALGAAAVLAFCDSFHHLNSATPALLTILLILAVSIQWGWAEALGAAVLGTLGLDYYFLPPRGFGIEQPQHIVAMITFLVTAIATGQLSALAQRHRAEANQRRLEIEKLFRLGNAILDSENIESMLGKLAGHLTEIFGLEGAVVYDQLANRIYRSGPKASLIGDQQLRTVASGGLETRRATGVSITPIYVGGRLAASLGIVGAVSPTLWEGIRERVAVGLAKSNAAKKAAEAEVARRSEELKSAVLDALAHEIKAPLAAIKVAVTVLQSPRPPGEADQRDLLSIIDQEADRLRGKIDDATRLSSARASSISLKKAPEPVESMVSRALEDAGPLLRDRPVEIQIPDALPRAQCDRTMIAKVLTQLLDNALKYSPAGTPVRISSEYTDGAVVISVADSGPGVAEEERDQIFQSHYRGSSVDLQVPGTGLGLASAKYIVESHGGKIWVTGQPSSGAEFHISLPVAEEESAR
jgi:two-component system, OmpR family, sensor histidine kinase KdpD